MKQYYIIIAASLIALIIGIFFFCFKHEIITIKNPMYTTVTKPPSTLISKKKSSIIFWHHATFKTESLELLWSEHVEQNVFYLVNSWLNILEEEHLLDKKVMLQTAMTNNTGQLFLSFDRNPLPKEESIFTKLMWIEGLLHTIRTNNVPIQTVYFLVHHQPLQDQHLDFSNPWPVTGFLQP